MEDIFKKLNLQERGLNVDGEKLTDRRFADDVALITTSVKDMEVQLNELNQGRKRLDSAYTREKTKSMTNFQSDETIVIENDVIEKVDRYKYLGQTVMMENQTREVMIRIKAGWSCFGRFKDILCDRKLPMSLMKRMYNHCAIPTMTYGAEKWTTTKQLEQKLITAQRAMERRMLNVTIRDKIRNSEIRKQTQVKDIMVKIKEANWRWAGHLMRKDDNRWTRSAVDKKGNRMATKKWQKN